MINRKTILSILLLILPNLLLTGCKKPPSEEQTTQAAYDPKKDPLVNPPSLFEQLPEDLSQIATDETLYLRLGANPNTLNPLFVSSTYDFMVVDPLFTGMFTFEKDLLWKLNDEMVEEFIESEDHTEFIIKIKSGYTWHDGHPWTAHDIVYSWQQILDPQVPCQTQKPTTEPIKQCIALDDYTIKYVQPEPLATRHWNLSFSILPKHIFEKHKKEFPDLKTGEYYNNLARNPVGSGPYRLVEWVANTKIVLERWDDFAGEKPYFKTIVFRIIPDDNMAMLSFEKQQLDAMDQLSAQKFAWETTPETLKDFGYKALGEQWVFGYIGWNMDGSNPFFNDQRVRYAMTHALNIPLILDKIFYKLATPCYGNYHSDNWAYNPEIAPVAYDLKMAGEKLDEAGWLINPDDGWRYKDIEGKPVLFEFTLLVPQESPYSPKIAAIYQEDLKKIGIRLSTRLMEFSSFIETVRKHEFQAEIAAWGTGTDPDTGWNLWRTEEYSKGRNYGGYSNKRVDELFALGRREFDFEKRARIYQDIHKTIYEDQPYTWIYYRPVLALFNKRIKGVQFSPRGIYNFDPSFSGWWIQKN